MLYTVHDLQAFSTRTPFRTLVETFVIACIRADHETFRLLWAKTASGRSTPLSQYHSEGIEAIAEALHPLGDEQICFTQLIATGVTIDGDTAGRWPIRA